MKWYTKILYLLLFIIFLPIIIPVLIVLWLCTPFVQISKIVKYKKSFYYKDFKVAYKNKITYSPQYRFYNAIKADGTDQRLNIQYNHQRNYKSDYFVYQNVVYLFPNFDAIQYNKANDEWQIIYRKYSEESCCELDKYIEINKPLPDTTQSSLPTKIIVERSAIEVSKLDKATLPDCLYVVSKYENAFDTVDWQILSIIPQTATELYQMVQLTPNLCGQFCLVDDNAITWTLDTLYATIEFDLGTCTISISQMHKDGKQKQYFTHWHVDTQYIYDEVCQMSQKGNVLVIKIFLGTSQVKYLGDKKYCKYKKHKKSICSKIHYFEIE